MRKDPISPSRRMVSRTGEHALRAALFLGRRRGAELVSAAEIARALGTPPNYTAKTLQRLTRMGLLRSVRGPQGGFGLRGEPADISVADLLAAVDEVVGSRAVCLLGDRACDAAHPCAAHVTWTEVQKQANEPLESTTLADLLAGDPNAGGS